MHKIEQKQNNDYQWLRPSFYRSSETLGKKGDSIVVVVRMVRNFSNDAETVVYY